MKGTTACGESGQHGMHGRNKEQPTFLSATSRTRSKYSRADRKPSNPYFETMRCATSMMMTSPTIKRAAPKTVNLKVGTMRAIARRSRPWAAIRPDVRMLRSARTLAGPTSAGPTVGRRW